MKCTNKQDNIEIITAELTEEGDLRLLLDVEDSIDKSKERVRQNKRRNRAK